MATKIIKNNTGSAVDIADVGVRIPASGQITVTPQEYALWATSTNLQTLIDASTLTINDGTNDISTASVAKHYMNLSTEAFGMRFLPNAVRSNGFTSTNVQEAIEEAKGATSPTASNVNVGGVGVFKQKTGINFEFRGINAGSSKITITNDSGNNEIDVDVAEASLTLNNLGGTLGVSKGGTGATSFTTGSVIFMGASGYMQDNSNLFWDDTNNRIGIGTSSPGHDLHVIKTNTDTSGTLSTGNFTKTLNPGSNSTATHVNLDSVIVTAGTSTNKANSIQAARHISYRNSADSGNIVDWYGTVSQLLNQAVFGTGSGSFGTAIANNVQMSDNSSTTTASTTMRGTQISVSTSTNLSGSRVITNYDALYASLNTNSAAGTTYTNPRVATFDPSAGANQGGTFTNPIAVLINPWTTTQGTGAGVTYTNAPEQLRLASMSVSNSIAIRQQGTTPHSRFEGNVMIGADSAPSTALHVYKASGTVESTVQSDGVICKTSVNSSGGGLATIGTTSSHDFQIRTGSGIMARFVDTFYLQMYYDIVGTGKNLGTNGIPWSSVHAEDFYINNGVGQEIRHGASTISSSYTLNWPSSQGGAGTFLKNDGSGGLTWASGATTMPTWLVAGSVNGVGGSVTSEAGISESTSAAGITMAYAGKVIAITISNDNARTAGTCIGKWLKNGVVQSGTVTIDGTNTTSHRTTGLSVTYAAGDVLRLQTVTSSFTPTGADSTVAIYCQDT